MLISLDSILSLNMPLDFVSSFVFFYWLASGLIIQAILMFIDITLPVGFYSHSKGTVLTRRILYFVAGGAILPMLFFIVPSILIASFIGNFCEEKFNRNK
ncbi:hypothetical protein [Fluviispira sanaruensis]|uniref:Uncharacterized protein n=1 Tax=Fluviispira sanaruensis TaxID=2493639 RepID=A0A4P2VS40_FLUSA|nr:hypothetical protein [Fluviispira sanaruensis]BBH52065.1 hypothetical protein JCM31447_05020 [Fluviispira sanaruensis]